jgi:hypothetical protein
MQTIVGDGVMVMVVVNGSHKHEVSGLHRYR